MEKKPRFTNCLNWAIKKFHKDGGHIIISPSKHGWWYHFSWAPHVEGVPQEQFIPTKPKELKDLPKIVQKFPLHIMFYEGKVVDENENEIQR